MKYILILSAILTVSACTVKQKFHFNADWSGTMETQFDASEMLVNLYGDSASYYAQSFLSDSSFLNSMKNLENTEGISNVKLEDRSGTGNYFFSYNFSSIEVLNKSLSNTDISTGMPGASGSFFTLKGKKLTYAFPEIVDTTEVDENAMVDNMMNFSIELSFEKTIKSVDTESDKVQLSEDKHTVTWVPLYSQLTKQGGNSITIKVNRK